MTFHFRPVSTTWGLNYTHIPLLNVNIIENFLKGWLRKLTVSKCYKLDTVFSYLQISATSFVIPVTPQGNPVLFGFLVPCNGTYCAVVRSKRVNTGKACGEVPGEM